MMKTVTKDKLGEKLTMGNYKTLNEYFFQLMQILEMFRRSSPKIQIKNFMLLLEMPILRRKSWSIFNVPLKLNPGDKVGLMSDKPRRMGCCRYIVFLNGAVNVPRGSDSTRKKFNTA